MTALAPDRNPLPLPTDMLLYHVAPGSQTLAELQAVGTVATALTNTTFAVRGRS